MLEACPRPGFERSTNEGFSTYICWMLDVHDLYNLFDGYRQLLAEPGVIKATSQREWPSRGLSSGTPDLNRLACSGTRKEGGAQHAIEHTKPHPGYVPMFTLVGKWPALDAIVL